MTSRELSIEKGLNGGVFAVFNSNCGKKRRLLMPAEIQRAAEALGDEWLEDNFCYSIA